MRFAFAITALALAAPALGAPMVQERQSKPPGCTSTTTKSDVVCSGLVNPLRQFFNYQAGNAAVSSSDILTSVNNMLDASGQTSSVNTIVKAGTNGLASSVINGVSNTLYGIASALDAADPQCKCNLGYCNSELLAAESAAQSGQAEAKDACLQAKYTCAGFYTSKQINSAAPGCAQYSSS